MPIPSNLVTIHPYFKIHPGKKDVVLSSLSVLVDLTSKESLCVFYDFTIMDDILYCREGFAGATGALQHMANVGDAIKNVLVNSDMVRFEIHGKAEDLDQLRVPFESFNPSWFLFHYGVDRS